MKIIKEGIIPKYNMTCKHCGTEFEYQLSEVCFSVNFHPYKQFLSISCPVCELKIGWYEGEESKANTITI